LDRGVVLMGRIWLGGDAEPFPGVVVVDSRGIVDYAGPGSADTVPPQLPVIGTPTSWVGPGIVDAHVHLGFGSVECLRSGLVGVRDLGAPMASARSWRTGHRTPSGERPVIAVSGPILTAPGGYPSRSWGRAGYAMFVASASHARQVVQRIAADGADVVKVALETGEQGWPVLAPTVLRSIVSAAHDTGLAVVAHALSVELVRRAVDAGVDELAHTPTELLPEELVERLAGAGISVVSTLQTFFSTGAGRTSAANATALYKAGVLLRYGTDLGNAGTHPGVDPRELDRLADTGMGRLGALQAATRDSASAPGIRGRTGLIQAARPAALVVLAGDPLAEPGVWRAPTAVVADGRLLLNTHP
jgi:imidazolonepropionase-like amidohydrolase